MAMGGWIYWAGKKRAMTVLCSAGLWTGPLGRSSRAKPAGFLPTTIQSSFARPGRVEDPSLHGPSIPPQSPHRPYTILLNWRRRLSLRIEERHLHDLRRYLLPDGFDGDFHLQLGADLECAVSTLANAIIFFNIGDHVVVVALPTCLSPVQRNRHA